MLPIFQRIKRVDMRTRNRDLLRQMVITRDNVTVRVNAPGARVKARSGYWGGR